MAGHAEMIVATGRELDRLRRLVGRVRGRRDTRSVRPATEAELAAALVEIVETELELTEVRDDE